MCVCVCVCVVLTPEVLGQAQQEPHCLVVAVPGGAGGSQHQGLGTRRPGGPQDAVHVGATHHLTHTGHRQRPRDTLGGETQVPEHSWTTKMAATRCRGLFLGPIANVASLRTQAPRFSHRTLTYLSLFSSGKGKVRVKLWVNTSSP